MVMVLMKNTACVVLVFLCAVWLSTARLNPTENDDHKKVINEGAAVNEFPDIKESIAFSVTKITKLKSLAAFDEGNLNKANAKLLMSKSKQAKFASNVEAKRNLRSYSPDEVNGEPLAFTADYHRPVHHPPKNNK
ncbi:uncharacterized protein LOC114917073 [Cajanus cajan]|uniref:uncharacterized protein LOC114917073 n=1 Tax=Cajanus cajan TaxID=3821 RepID=UPI0010FBB97E|nr:uncharacterized protein LOC114917073 [Cajanus cajan]